MVAVKWGLEPSVRSDRPGGQPSGSLARFRYHTGATLRPVSADEACPVLFRDIGAEAMQLFLEGRLKRLAGPFAPITYMRTSEWPEPYQDYEQTGRLVLLQPELLHVWHSGIPSVFVSEAGRVGDVDAIGFVPGSIPLVRASEMLTGVRTKWELREALGGSDFDVAVRDTHGRLTTLNQQCRDAEQRAEPLRRALQSRATETRERAQEEMARLDITEHDLCAAWHHVPRERREHLVDALQRLSLSAAEGTP